MKARARLAVVIVALLATACSGGKSSSSTTPSPSALGRVTPASPTASPTPSVLTIAQARARYLALVAPLNASLNRWEAAVKAGQLARQRALAREYDARMRTFDAALLSTAWPASVVGTARKLAEANAADLAFLRAFQNVRTRSDLSAALQAYNADPNYRGVPAQVELMRTLLGLPKAA